MFTVILVSLALLLLVHCFWKKRKLPPGPWGLPIIGYLPWINPQAPHHTFAQLAKKYGPIYSLSLGSIQAIVLSDTKLIKTLFSKDVTTGRAPLYMTHGIMNGYGIICSEGDLWKDQRKLVTNWLRSIGCAKIGPHRRKMGELILKHANWLINSLLKTSTPIDPEDIFRHHLGSVINEIVFGTYYEMNNNQWMWLQNMQKVGTELIGIAAPLNFLPFLRFLPMFNRTMSFLIEGQIETHRFYQNLIDEEEKILWDRSRSSNLDTNRAYTSLLQGFLIEKEKRKGTDDVDKYYNDQQFYHLLADVFGAGLDTTLTTFRWFILFMSLNEDIQSEVQNEIRSVLNDRAPSMEDIEFMPVTEACIAETQRIRSVLPLGLPHGVSADFEINGYVIPKGAMVIPLQWAIHMNDKSYANPDIFNPKNFLDEQGRFVKNENFIPFQCGKRMCVGDELARMMLFIFGVSVLQKFHLEITDKKFVNLEGSPGITLTPKLFNVRFKPLDP
ncbi:cytochrome P450 306a1 [Euwallacea similis]|uniref:cytochrome P450 306a1 n=1 Tax=Euwallacea similis TaxID=1736056 RepID=UPI00344F995A